MVNKAEYCKIAKSVKKIYLCNLLRRYGLCFAMRITKAKLGLLGRELI